MNPDTPGIDLIRPARADELDTILALLAACGLPGADLRPSHLADFVVAESGAHADGLVGVAGLEHAGPDALLRSVAVRADRRGQGLGARLVAHCLQRARQAGSRALYLIPNDAAAADFFAARGYTPVDRASLPQALLALPEFTHLCPQTHPCLRQGLAPHHNEETIMKTLEVFDPAMCCSTGVCGVEVDPVLAQFAADLKWVEEHGVSVTRHNLGQEPQAFAANPAVLKEMEAGMDRLPILAVDGHIVSTGMYPSRLQLAQKLGIPLSREEKPRIKISVAGCDPKSGCC